MEYEDTALMSAYYTDWTEEWTETVTARSQTITTSLQTTPNEANSGPGTTVIALAATLGAVGILFIVFLGLYVALKQRRTRRGKFSRPDTMSYMYGMTEMGRSISTQSNLFLELKAFVPRVAEKDVQITDEIIGEGRFGPMYNGVLKVNGENKHVIYKTLKDSSKESERRYFMEQLEIYSSFEFHVNIIRLYGVCISSNFGNLRQFLRKYSAMPESQRRAAPDIPDVTPIFLLNAALGIASGMRHLASRGIVHRELAAKHVMLSGDFTTKIAGLNTVKAVNKHISLRWMSPEVMSDRMYTLMSDVWSFGVVLWEIMSMGAKPFPNTPTRDIYLALQNGTRMAKPADCDANIYSLMKWCWEDDPYERPSFVVITKTLKEMIASSTAIQEKKIIEQPSVQSQDTGVRIGVENASFVTANSLQLNDASDNEIYM